MLLKILAVGIITVVSSLLIRQYKSDISLLINICGGLIIMYMLLGGLTSIFKDITFISDNSNISSSVIAAIVKVICASYLTEFCADIAEDSGNKFVATKVLIGGKVAICIMAFPIIKTLFQTIIALI